MSVVKINAIEIPEGAGPELEARFAARAGAVENSPGFEGFQLLRPVEGETPLLRDDLVGVRGRLPGLDEQPGLLQGPRPRRWRRPGAAARRDRLVDPQLRGRRARRPSLGLSMLVCVVGSGGREHALADVLSRSAEVVVTPGNPGIPGSVADAAGGDRRRPVRHRTGGAARRRPGRPAAGPGPPGLRPGSRRRAARGLEGVDEGAGQRRRGAHRPPRHLRRPRRRARVPGHDGAAVRGQDRRPCRRQGRGRHRLAHRGPQRGRRTTCRGRRSATPGGPW